MFQTDPEGWISGRLRSRVGFRLLTACAICALIISCASTNRSSRSDQVPFATGLVQIDVALELAARLDDPARTELELDSAAALADAGETALAAELMRYIAPIGSTGNLADDDRFRVRVRAAAVANRIAAVDENFVDRAEELSGVVLEQAGRERTRPDRWPLLVELFGAVATNPNASQATIRSTIDELYLLRDPQARARALVAAAEIVASESTPTALNPIMQQALPAVSALDDPASAILLDARLAAVAGGSSRSGDRDSLVARVDRRVSRIVSPIVTDVDVLVVIGSSLAQAAAVDMVPTAIAALAVSDADLFAYLELARLAASAGLASDAERAVALAAAAVDESVSEESRVVIAGNELFARAVAGEYRTTPVPVGRVAGHPGLRSADRSQRVEALGYLVAALATADQMAGVERVRPVFRDSREAQLAHLWAVELASVYIPMERRRLLLDTAVGLIGSGSIDTDVARRLAREMVAADRLIEAAPVIAALPPEIAGRLVLAVPVGAQLSANQVVALRRVLDNP